MNMGQLITTTARLSDHRLVRMIREMATMTIMLVKLTVGVHMIIRRLGHLSGNGPKRRSRKPGSTKPPNILVDTLIRKNAEQVCGRSSSRALSEIEKENHIYLA